MDIKNQLEELQQELNGTEDFIERMDIQGRIDDLKIKSGEMVPPKPADSPYECEGCSA